MARCWRIPLVGGIMLVGGYGIFHFLLGQGASLEAARTAALNTIVLMECAYLINARYLHAPVLNFEGLFGNWMVWPLIGGLILLQLVVTYAPFMNTVLGTAPLEPVVWLWMAAGAALLLLVVDLDVRIRRLLRQA